MPVAPTYPGVYVEEIPSGVRTITGVSTSVTAFVGYTKRGSLNKAETVLSYADFERKFGGLSTNSAVSYAVQQFFQNGGQSAYVVRITQGGTAQAAAVKLKNLDGSKVVMQITAKEPGVWANGLLLSVDYETVHPDSTFNLRLLEPVSGQSEVYLGLTMDPRSTQAADKMVNATSKLIKVEILDKPAADAPGESRSGSGIAVGDVDAQHREFMITLSEEDGPLRVTIYDGVEANRPNNLQQLIDKIVAAVKALGGGREPYQSFACSKDDGAGTITLTSTGGFVRVTGGGALDAARVLKLGVANSGREVDAGSAYRPAPTGTSSGELSSWPTFTATRKVMVTMDGDGPHEVLIYNHGVDAPPTDLEGLGKLVQKGLAAVKPKQPGSMAFKGISTRVAGSRMQIQPPETAKPEAVLTIEKVRILENLNAVHFIDPIHGWAVGNGGTIVATTDGAAWKPQASMVTKNLNAVYFVNATNGWVVGEGGTIIVTVDGGTNWTSQNSTVTVNLNGVHFTDATHGWAVGNGGKIVATTNGTAWNPQASPVTKNLNAIFSLDTTKGWAVGEGGTIIATVDGGTNWNSQNSPVTVNLNAVHFTDATHGWAVGDGGTIITTTDGGANWGTQASTVTVNLKALHFSSLSKGWAVGARGTLLQYDSAGGGTWTAVPSEVTANLTSGNIFVTAGATSGWVVGENGLIRKLAGGSWTTQQCIIDPSADDLKLAQGSCQNVRAYVLGVGKSVGAQTGAVAGNDGLPPRPEDYRGSRAKKTGIYALLDVDIFNILCLPGVEDFGVLAEATALCEERRAFFVMDCPRSWQKFEDALGKLADYDGLRHKNTALYFPWVSLPDPLDRNRLNDFPPCGIVAGIYARTDAERGVWKAPAGQEASLRGVNGLVYKLIDQENGFLNPLGLNCLRNFPVVGPVIWGARTLEGADQLASEWKYIPVRRLALFLEESLYRGVKWVVFEPNDEPLWSQIRLNVGAFMHNLFRQGAFQGASPREAYFVKCDKETTTQNDINLGIVNILVGFAPLKPAEFVILKISQIAGQVQT